MTFPPRCPCGAPPFTEIEKQTGVCFHCRSEEPVKAADRALIAAAPDLLDCTRVWLEEMIQNGAPEYSAQMRMARAAIAKATTPISEEKP
jgi:hypothetical protein